MSSKPKPLANGLIESVLDDGIVFLDYVGIGALIAVCDEIKNKSYFLYLKNTDQIETEKELKIINELIACGQNLICKVIGEKTICDQIVSKITKTPDIKLVEKFLGAEPCQIFCYSNGRIRVGKVNSSPKSDTNQDSIEHTQKKKIKVLVVDDSKTICILLKGLFEKDPGIEVVKTCMNPLEVEGVVESFCPDVMTMDIHMPHINGVDLLKKILPKKFIPTVMISSITKEESTHVLNALEIGAVDYIQKPSFDEMPKLGPMILEKVKTASFVKQSFQSKPIARGEKKRPVVVSSEGADFTKIIAIGSSTGGTEALKSLFMRLPEKIPPIVVVQHIPAVFSKAFADRLNELCPFTVKEAENGDSLLPNQVLIAPGGFQLHIEKGGPSGFRVKIEDAPPVNRHKPSVDVLFDSVAKLLGKKSIGIMLTGMGGDGSKGMLKMKEAGAYNIAQSEKTCVVFGMPKEALKIGAAHCAVDLEDIPQVAMNCLQGKLKAA